MNDVTIHRDVYFEENAHDDFKELKLDSMTFVLFGASGDLAKRKIYPALYNLFLDKKMPNSFSVVGIGRRDWSDAVFQNYVKESLETFSRRFDNDTAKTEEFLRLFHFCSLDVTNRSGYITLIDAIQKHEEEFNIPENRLFYLSVAPKFVDVITTNIKESGLDVSKGWKRLIIEKPFGHDLKSARILNEKLSKAFQEEEIFRIDHYLGKPMVQNLEALGFANPVLQTLWNNKHIANVQITASETVGVEERAGYYDQAGAIRDMFQNHMLQILMMTAMHLPNQMDTKEIQNVKREVIESLRPLQKGDVGLNVIRGQYVAGEIDGDPVVGYQEEPGVRDSSTSDTFIAARLWIDNAFWGGVPFYIRTGKRMQDKSTRVVIEYKNPIKSLYMDRNEETPPNLLMIEISPNQGVSFQLNSKNPLNNGKIEPFTVDFVSTEKNVPEAYEMLIFDALRGDQSFFTNWNEVELSWKWVQPILEAFEENILPLHHYQSGSMGPVEAHQLLAKDGFHWW